MKKILTLVLVTVLCITFAACGGSGSSSSTAQASSSTASTEASGSAQDAVEPASTWAPNQPITIIVPYGAGGGQDIAARFLAKHAEQYVGQKFVVDNRPGGSGSIGNTAIMTAKPDGYTIGMFHNLSFYDQYLVDGATYTEESFIQLCAFTGDSTVIVANAKLGVTDIPGLIELAKASPGRITWGGPEFSSQTYPRMNVENAAGVEFGKMIFDGGANSLAAVAGGNCDVTSVFPSEYAAMSDNPDIVAIATCGTERMASLPEIPTMIEQGVDATFFQVRSFVVPAGTPDEIVAFYDEAFQKALADEACIQELIAGGFNPLKMGSKEATEYMLGIFNDNKESVVAAFEAAAKA